MTWGGEGGWRMVYSTLDPQQAIYFSILGYLFGSVSNQHFVETLWQFHSLNCGLHNHVPITAKSLPLQVAHFNAGLVFNRGCMRDITNYQPDTVADFEQVVKLLHSADILQISTSHINKQHTDSSFGYKFWVHCTQLVVTDMHLIDVPVLRLSQNTDHVIYTID